MGKETQGKFKGARNSMKMRRFANKYRKMVRFVAPPAPNSLNADEDAPLREMVLQKWSFPRHRSAYIWRG